MEFVTDFEGLISADRVLQDDDRVGRVELIVRSFEEGCTTHLDRQPGDGLGAVAEVESLGITGFTDEGIRPGGGLTLRKLQVDLLLNAGSVHHERHLRRR